MAEKYSAQLKRRANRIWRVIHGHPFLRELHAGTLPMDRFIYFILQDYVYLLDFAQVLCQGGAKSPDLETLSLFCRHALGAVEVSAKSSRRFSLATGSMARSAGDCTRIVRASRKFIVNGSRPMPANRF